MIRTVLIIAAASATAFLGGCDVPAGTEDMDQMQMDTNQNDQFDDTQTNPDEPVLRRR
jgi:hypothetical protein